MLDKTFNSVKD